MFDIKPIDLSEDGLKEIQVFLKLVFPHASHLSLAYLRWLYVDNPNGQAVGANVYDGSMLIAHFPAQAIATVFKGVAEKGLLALNVAVRPDYRGKGLFKLAGEAMFELAKVQGYGHVIGAANAASTKPWLKHMNAQLIGPLDVKVGGGWLPGRNEAHNFAYKLQWGSAALDWRLKRPGQCYFFAEQAGEKKLYTKAPIVAGLGPYLELGTIAESVSLPEAGLAFYVNPMRLWIGFDSSRDWSGTWYADIPEKFRPSPLNVIFCDLTGQRRRLERGDVRLDALDFDVY
jgi:GNAT superfamily N-acetyltransferase